MVSSTRPNLVRPNLLGLKFLSTPSSFDPYSSLNPFEGWTSSTLVCTSCQHERPSVNTPFVALSLSPLYSIEDSLRHFTSPETLSQVECRSCLKRRQLSRLVARVEQLAGTVLELSSVIDRLVVEVSDLASVVATLEREVPGSTFILENAAIHAQKEAELAKMREEHEGRTKELDDKERDRALLEMLRPDVDELAPEEEEEEEDRGKRKGKGRGRAAARAQPVPRTRAVKRLAISRAPKDLCLHIQRRFYDASMGRMVKNNQSVAFGSKLDIQAFFSGTKGLRGAPASDTDGQFLERADSRSSPIEYELLSVVEHLGSESSGHYVSYKKLNNDVWMRFSDEQMRIVSKEQLLKCQAFLLFYRRTTS